jgi:hypothetical protein
LALAMVEINPEARSTWRVRSTTPLSNHYRKEVDDG